MVINVLLFSAKDASAPISHVSCDACYAALETIGFKV